MEGYSKNHPLSMDGMLGLYWLRNKTNSLRKHGIKIRIKISDWGFCQKSV